MRDIWYSRKSKIGAVFWCGNLKKRSRLQYLELGENIIEINSEELGYEGVRAINFIPISFLINLRE
jgi:hypothetical protein